MKKIIRDHIFETNSSAVHSLVFSKDGLEPSNLPVDNEGYILTDFGNFGDYDMGYDAFDQATKLSYIATECFYLNHYDKEIDDYYIWKLVCEAIMDYVPDVSGVKILGNVEPELNHQVIPDYEPKFCNVYDEDSVIDFIFNKHVGIKMSHD